MWPHIQRVVVTGATGFIGSALVRRLSGAGIQTLCFVRPGSTRRNRLENLPNVELVEISSSGCDLSKRLVELKPELVYNLGSAGVNPDDRDPAFLLAGNVGLITALVTALQNASPSRLIHIGSCSEYAPAEAGRLLDENAAVNPPSIYGAAKACAFMYGGALAARLNVPFITLRLFGVYGPGEAPHRLVPSVISHLQRNEPIELTGGEQVRDLIYVDDAVEALLAAAACEELQAGSAYNVCSSRAIKIRQVAECVAECMHKPKSLLRFGQRPYRDDEPMWIVGDNRRFSKLAGWSPQVTLQQGISQSISQTM